MEKERRKEGRKRERKDGKKVRPLVDLECGPAQPSLFSLANWDVCFLIAVRGGGAHWALELKKVTLKNLIFKNSFSSAIDMLKSVVGYCI